MIPPTPKEQANELIKTYMELFGRHDRCVTDNPNIGVGYRHAKECALLCVNKILMEELKYDVAKRFWENVKSEIEKL